MTKYAYKYRANTGYPTFTTKDVASGDTQGRLDLHLFQGSLRFIIEPHGERLSLGIKNKSSVSVHPVDRTTYHLNRVLIRLSLLSEMKLLHQRIVYAIYCGAYLLHGVLRLKGSHVQLELRFEIFMLWSREFVWAFRRHISRATQAEPPR